jgi:lysophospholipase L1-like esterase
MKSLFLVLVLACLAGPSLAEPRILVFGDSNSWGWVPVETGFPTTRYDDRTRWPGVLEMRLEEELGRDVTVVVDAMSGRTVDAAYPEATFGLPGEAFAGLPAFGPALARELPLDLVVVMLGTNDARSDLGLDPEAVGAGIARMIERARTLSGGIGTTYPAPEILVVLPPPVGDVSRTPIAGVMVDGAARSQAVNAAIRQAAEAAGAAVFDAAAAVPVADGVDGVHLSAAAHARLGEAIAQAVLPLIRGEP